MNPKEVLQMAKSFAVYPSWVDVYTISAAGIGVPSEVVMEAVRFFQRGAGNIDRAIVLAQSEETYSKPGGN